MKTNGAKPNILLIQADQLTPKVLPTYGHQLVKAPHIQALAERGVVFDKHYCNFPLCAPSRASMLAGRLPHAIASWDNATEMPASIPTIAHYLRMVGYYTVLCGKMHFIGPDQVHGYNERITTDIYPSNFAWTPDWVKGERYRPTGINMSAVIDAGQCVRSLQLDYDEEVEHAGVQKLYDLARFSEAPFFLTVSFTHPHSPYIITDQYWDLYDHQEVDLPAVPPIPLDKQDQMSRWLYYAHAGDLHEVSNAHVRNARHAYYGMTSYIDDKVGRLMKTLQDTGLADNTVVIFTADHGEMLGERGMWYKQSFYEWSCRVPFIVSYPRRYQPGRVSVNTSLVDLLPSLMDIATDGNEPEYVSPMDGRSLVGLLKNNNAPWNDQVIAEYTGEGVCAPCRMLKKNDYKYIYIHGYPSLLYNLVNDPMELNNLADHAKYADIKKNMHDQLLDDWDPDDIARRVLATQKERFLIQNATSGLPTWGYFAETRSEQRYVRNSGAVQTKAKARYPFVEPTPFKQ